MADWVKCICDEFGVCREEALLYHLEGYSWNLYADSAIEEACYSQTSPSLAVNEPSTPPDSRAFLNPPPEQQQSQSKNRHINYRPMNEPSTSKLSSPPQLQASFDTLKEVNIRSSSSSSQSAVVTEASPPLSRETNTTNPSSQVISDSPQSRECRITVEPPESSTSSATERGTRNQWARYVKSCHEMILFLTAAGLAFVPIRYLLDEQSCGARFQDVAEYLLRWLADFDMTPLDPFISFSLAYATFYILSSSSLPDYMIQYVEVASIVSGFCIVFLVIYYISPITFKIGVASFGLSAGVITAWEFIIARRSGR